MTARLEDIFNEEDFYDLNDKQLFKDNKKTKTFKTGKCDTRNKKKHMFSFPPHL